MTVAFFLEVGLKSTTLLAAACAVALCLRKNSAALRHQVWTLSLAAVLVLPILSMALPALRVPVAHSALTDNFVFRADAQPMATPNTPLHKTNGKPAPNHWLTNTGSLLTALWAIGAAIGFVQILVGCLAIKRLRRHARPLHMPGVDGNVDLRETAAGSMPVTYGFFHPVILLPADALQWSPERRRVVLLHELAHILRHDASTHLLARMVLALYWWHPLVWLAWRESMRERELAADDMVLNTGTSSADYASHLLSIARSMQMPTAALAMARPSQLQTRLAAILDSQRNRTTPQRTSALAACFAALVILLPLAALQAKSNPVPLVAAALQTNPLPAESALIAQGKSALSNRNYELAANFFERAVDTNPQKSTEAKMWLAVTEENQRNPEKAASLYQDALAIAEPDSLFEAVTLELYARVLRELNRDEEAKTISHRALVIREAQGQKAMTEGQAPGPDVRKIGGDVKPPKLISKMEPKYSEDARLAKYSGTIVLFIEVGTDGNAHNIKIKRSLGFGLDQKAAEAVGSWKFDPATLNGQPVAVFATVEVNFRLL